MYIYIGVCERVCARMFACMSIYNYRLIIIINDYDYKLVKSSLGWYNTPPPPRLGALVRYALYIYASYPGVSITPEIERIKDSR